MPRYGDDQCEECGGIRVAKSTLCANCLVKLYRKAILRGLAQENELEILKERFEDYRRQLEVALAYGFKKNQENVRLLYKIEELMDDIHGPEGKDG